MIQRLKIRTLIKQKGGASRVAGLCGVAQPSVSRWAAQGSIPQKYALLLEQLWGIDADLMHNPWGSERSSWVSEQEQEAIVCGDYDLRLDAPRRVPVEYSIDDPVEYSDHDDGDYTGVYDEPAPKVERGRVPSDDEIEAILREMNSDGNGQGAAVDCCD